jgi:hypothetical protein
MNKILYIGAGEDLTPLYIFPESKFIYIDSKPRNPYGYPYYYKPIYSSKFKEQIISKLRENKITQISETVFTDDFKEINVPDLNSHMIDFGRLKYYFSTSIPHEDYIVFNEKIISSIDILPDTVFVRGHYPNEDSLKILKKPFNFIGSYPTYFPKDIEEIQNYNKENFMIHIILNKNNDVSKYIYIDSKGDMHMSSNYEDFYRNYKRYKYEEGNNKR